MPNGIEEDGGRLDGNGEWRDRQNDSSPTISSIR